MQVQQPQEVLMVKMLRLPQVQEATGMSPTTIWRREKSGEFPRRRRIGPNLVAWRSDEVEAWIERQAPAT